MLQVMREKMQGWIAGIIVGLIIIALGFWGVSSYLNGSNTQGSIIATFDHGSITQQQLDSVYNRYRMQNRNQVPSNIDAVNSLKSEMLNQLVTQQILAQAAAHNHFNISQAQIDSVLLSIPYFQVDGQFSQARFEAVVQQALFTVNGFLENMKNTMLINQMQSGLFSTTFSLPGEVQNVISLTKETRDFQYALLPFSKLKRDVNVTDQAIANYYQQNRKQFMLPETVKVRYVTLSAAEIMDKLAPSAAQLKQFYQNNISDYMQPARWRVAHILLTGKNAKTTAQKIYKQLQNGGDFSQLVKHHSQDKLSIKTNGVLPWFSAGQLDPSFEAAAAGLKPGQVAAPVNTKYGVEIIKLIAKQQQQPLPYNQVVDKVRKAYLSQETQKKFSDIKDELANISFENPNSLAPVEKYLKTKAQQTVSFTRDGAKSGIAKSPQFVAAAFSSDVLAGDNSDVITLSPGQVVVLRIANHQSSQVQPLAQVVGEIKAVLVEQQVAQNMTQLAQKVQDALKAGSSLAHLAKQYGLQWQSVSRAQRYSSKPAAAIVAEAFSLPKPTKQLPTIGEVQLMNHDYAVVAVTATTEGNSSAISKTELSTYAANYKRVMAELEYTEYVKYLHNKANVKIKK